MEFHTATRLSWWPCQRRSGAILSAVSVHCAKFPKECCCHSSVASWSIRSNMCMWACREKPKVVRAFLRATSRGFQYAAEHPAEAAQNLLAAAPEGMDKKLAVASQAVVSKVCRRQALWLSSFRRPLHAACGTPYCAGCGKCLMSWTKVFCGFGLGAALFGRCGEVGTHACRSVGQVFGLAG